MGRVDPEAAVRRYHMLDGAEALSVTVALSGGADSVLLLSLLREWQPKYGYRLSAAHLNHMLRGEESDRDEAFVRAVCEKWSVPLRVERIPVAEAAAPGESVEMAARRIRYAFLDEAAMDFDAGAGTVGFLIAMAHTMSDQAETVLYRLARGSGLKGAGGIPPKRDCVIRPLCELTREDVEALCRERGLDYVTDSSNASDLYARNRIRHQVLPALRRVHPGAVEALARFAGNAREDDALLEGLAAEGLEKSRYIGTALAPQSSAADLREDGFYPRGPAYRQYGRAARTGKRPAGAAGRTVGRSGGGAAAAAAHQGAAGIRDGNRYSRDKERGFSWRKAPFSPFERGGMGRKTEN